MEEARRQPRVLALAGSLRRESYNRMLIRLGVEALRRAGAEVDLVDLREVAMPLYDGDLEAAEGLPEGAQAFKRRLARADGLMIASPEYNHSIPGTFKNALDWASRGDEDVFDGKVAALMAASTGWAGGMRMIPHLREVLTALGVWLVPEQVTIAKAGEAFEESGSLRCPVITNQVQALAESLVREITLRQPGTLQVAFYPEAEQSATGR